MSERPFVSLESSTTRSPLGDRLRKEANQAPQPVSLSPEQRLLERFQQRWRLDDRYLCETEQYLLGGGPQDEKRQPILHPNNALLNKLLRAGDPDARRTLLTPLYFQENRQERKSLQEILEAREKERRERSRSGMLLTFNIDEQIDLSNQGYFAHIEPAETTPEGQAVPLWKVREVRKDNKSIGPAETVSQLQLSGKYAEQYQLGEPLRDETGWYRPLTLRPLPLAA